MKLLILVLSLIAFPALATEAPQVPIGQWIKTPAVLVVCNTPDQAAQLMDIRKDDGRDAFMNAVIEFNKAPGAPCGLVEAYMMVRAVLWSGEVDQKPAAVAEVLLILPTGQPVPMALYSPMINVQLVEAGDEGKQPA